MEKIPNCPECDNPLTKVTYQGGSLNRDQWESVRAGDWYCSHCPEGDKPGSLIRYFWNKDVLPANHEPAERLDEIRMAIDRLAAERHRIAKEYISDFNFLDYAVSDFWECEDSPIGWCVFKLKEIGGRLIKTHCRYCGGPVERK